MVRQGVEHHWGQSAKRPAAEEKLGWCENNGGGAGKKVPTAV